MKELSNADAGCVALVFLLIATQDAIANAILSLL